MIDIKSTNFSKVVPPNESVRQWNIFWKPLKMKRWALNGIDIANTILCYGHTETVLLQLNVLEIWDIILKAILLDWIKWKETIIFYLLYECLWCELLSRHLVLTWHWNKISSHHIYILQCFVSCPYICDIQCEN